MNIEELKTIFPEMEITEELLNNVNSLIESTISEKVSSITKEVTDVVTEEVTRVVTEEIQEKHNKEIETLKEEFKKELDVIIEKAEEYKEYVLNEMSDQIDYYCRSVVKEFYKENSKLFIDTAEYNRMSKLVSEVRKAFESNYFYLDPEYPTISIEKKYDELKEKYNDVFNENIEISKNIEKLKNELSFKDITAEFNLSESQKEKLHSIVEQTHIDSQENFSNNLKLLIEETFVDKPTSVQEPVIENPSIVEPRTEETTNTDDDSVRIRNYLNGF